MNSFPFRRAALGTSILLAGFASACGDRAPTGPAQPPGTERLPAEERRIVQTPVMPNVTTSQPMLATCGAAVEFKLTDMKTVIGAVTVSNDAQQVYVTYNVTAPHWFISDTRLAVARTYADIPQDSYATPLPWSFPHVGEHEPVVTSHTYAIPLSSLGVAPGQQIVVSAMAGVVHPTTDKYEGPWEWLVMWGTNSAPGTKIQTMHAHTLSSCGGSQPAPPPPPPPPAAGGSFTITFDDGWEDTYTNAFPVLREFGLNAAVAVNPNAVDGRWTTYMNLTQLKALKAAGWSIVSHTLSHPDLTKLSDSELHRELRDSKAWIERNGFGPATTLIVPFHAWGPRELNVVKQYYAQARGYSVDQFYPARYTNLPMSANPYEIYGYEPEWAPFTTAQGRAATIAVIERAIRDGKHVDIFFHHVTSAQVSAFRELVRQMSAYKANLTQW